MYSIYHFFAELIRERARLTEDMTLEALPNLKASPLFSCRNIGAFPDRAIRLQPQPALYTGGELIEFKDSRSYSISSFNSTIPTGKKLVSALKPNVKQKMAASGDDLLLLPLRDVFYLVRGRDKIHTKVCLLHGSFFETIPVEQLIQAAFAQILEEGIGAQLSQIEKDHLAALFKTQNMFNRVRTIPNASVKPRFRIMTEATAEGNILNTARYPEIKPDSLNLVLPFYSSGEQERHIELTQIALEHKFGQVTIEQIKHPLNGWFIVFRCLFN